MDPHACIHRIYTFGYDWCNEYTWQEDLGELLPRLNGELNEQEKLNKILTTTIIDKYRDEICDKLQSSFQDVEPDADNEDEPDFGGYYDVAEKLMMRIMTAIINHLKTDSQMINDVLDMVKVGTQENIEELRGVIEQTQTEIDESIRDVIDTYE